MTLPTRNSQLALRRADFRTVPEMLDYAAEGETGVTFYSCFLYTSPSPRDS